jgi:SAM-dependent methyltransferase
MSDSVNPGVRSYDSVYESFDSPLMKELRAEAYGDDIGQHSWVTTAELRQTIQWLGLTRASHLLDLGCGPGGPLTYVVRAVGCLGTGLEVSAPAIAAARGRVGFLGLEGSVSLLQGDLNEKLDIADGSFEAVMSLDVVVHVHDRAEMFREVARVLAPGGRFVFTDAGVITGSVSDEDIRSRSIHGHTQFVPPGYNDRLLDEAGLRLQHREDRTAGLCQIAAGRLAARVAHRSELERLEGSSSFERQQQYLETVVRLAQRGALARLLYAAESQTPTMDPRAKSATRT